MTIIKQNIVSGMLQGDISYYVRVKNSTREYIDIEIISFSDKWESFDIDFEYRRNNRLLWRKDAIISQTTGSNVYGNRVYGLIADTDGYSNYFRWEYYKNDIYDAESPIIKISIIPRVISYGNAGTEYHTATYLYAKSKSDMQLMSSHHIIGVDYNGYYMCVDSDSFYLYDDKNDVIVKKLSGLSNPSFAIATLRGSYIICDTGNSIVMEIDGNLNPAPLLQYFVLSPVFIDFSDSNELLLITSDNGEIYEIYWNYGDIPSLLWQSTVSLSSPSCATYRKGNLCDIIISDTGNNRVIKYNRDSDIYSVIDHYKFSNVSFSGSYEITKFYEPYRAYWYDNDKICVIEKEGVILNWNTVESSSSSMGISSSTSSSSSESFLNVSSSSSESSESIGNTSSSESSLGWLSPFIPAMTDTSLPVPYTASAISEGLPAWHAFSQLGLSWSPIASFPFSGWLKIDIGVPIIIEHYSIMADGVFGPKTINLEASNDDFANPLNTVILDTQVNQTGWDINPHRYFVDVGDGNAYRYYRLNMSTPDYAVVLIKEFQLYDTI